MQLTIEAGVLQGLLAVTLLLAGIALIGYYGAKQ